MTPEVIELIKAIASALLPVAVAMFSKAMAGGDPLDVLAEEHVADILPATTRLELAQKAARARLAAKS